MSMDPLEVGAAAPGFSLKDDAGRTVRLEEHLGRIVVLYFYPEDDTPGCTVQACGFRDHFPAFGELDAVVLGVSPDPVESHAAFKAKYALPFRLLSDPDHKVASAYGAWGRKQMFGQEFDGIIRSTVLIDAKGRVASVHRNVRTEGHAQRMIEALRALG